MLLLAGLALAGCGDGPLASLAVRLHVAPPGAGGACTATGTDTPLVDGLPSVDKVRVTYRNASDGVILCDAVVPVADRSGVVGVPGGRQVVNLEVEAFDATNVLLASGEAHGIDLGSASSAKVLLARSQAFVCAPETLELGRAFHSATRLPNGEVLIVGGVVADPNDPGQTMIDLGVVSSGNTTGGLYATNRVEIYDPQAGTVDSYDVLNLIPRAFHEAYLLDSDVAGGFEVLLVGGLSVSGNPADTPVADIVRDPGEPLLVLPAPSSVGIPAEIVTYTPGMNRVTRREVTAMGTTMPPQRRTFQAASRPPVEMDGAAQAPPLLAGGFLSYPDSPALTFEGIDPATGLSTGNLTFFSPVDEQSRAQATVTWIEQDRALVFGGNLGSTAGNESTQAGIMIAGVPTAGTSAQMVLDAASEVPTARVGHTATAVGGLQVLIAGGFEVQAGQALGAPAVFAQLATFSGGGQNPPATFTNVTGPNPAVGYHDAVSIAPGVVLLAGGLGAEGASASAFRYASGSLTQLTSTLVVGRYGHRLTPLTDGTILITGGLTRSDPVGPPVRTVRDVELYNPRTALDDPRPPGTSAGPPCPVLD